MPKKDHSVSEVSRRNRLAESEQRFRRLAEAVTDYIYHVRVEDGRPVETVHGAKCEAVTGYSAQEFADNRMLWIAMVPEEDRAVVERQVACILSGQEAAAIEHRIRRKDGQIRWVLNTPSLQHDDCGRLIAYDGLLRDVTEKKQAEEGLRQLNEELAQRVDERTLELQRRTEQLAERSAELARREREFRTLTDRVPALFSYVDRSQRYCYVNRRYEELFQRPASEIVGKTIGELLGSQRYEIERPHVLAALRGEGVTYEADFDLAGGHQTMHVQYVPDFGEDREVRGFFTLVTDITAQRQAYLLAQAVSHLGEGIVITDDDLDWPGPRIRFVNEAMCRISGYSAEELIGQTPRMLQGGGTDRASLDRLRAELSAGRSSVVELVNYRKDGTPYDAELFVSPLFDTEGRRTNFVSIHRDVSQRKAAQASLRNSEERLRAILNTASDAIITIDRQGVITGVNPATEQMFGYTQDELVGQNVKILMPPPYCQEHDSYISRYFETGEARIIGIGREAVGRRKDGSTFPIGLAVSEVDHLGVFAGIIRDNSAVKELEKQVLEIAAEEDRRIGHELHDNIQQQLTGLGLLAKTVSDRLERAGARDDGYTETADLALRVATGINTSAQQVHLLSRGLVPVEVDAEGLRSALTDLTSRIVEQYGVQCELQCEGAVEVADNFVATHLYRIAQEAVNNAIKHGRANRIDISLSRVSESLTLKVLDNGIGIDDSRDPGPGMGLRTMQYRAGLIGATIVVGPGKEGGTLVCCTLLRRQ